MLAASLSLSTISDAPFVAFKVALGTPPDWLTAARSMASVL
jgi:hypothetical protein